MLTLIEKQNHGSSGLDKLMEERDAQRVLGISYRIRFTLRESDDNVSPKPKDTQIHP